MAESNNRKIFIGHIEVLARKGLIASSLNKRFNVLPEGFAYYDYIKRSAGEPIANMEGEIRTHLEVGPFHQKYMLAFQKWSEAEEKLWGSDSNLSLERKIAHRKCAIEQNLKKTEKQIPIMDWQPVI